MNRKMYTIELNRINKAYNELKVILEKSGEPIEKLERLNRIRKQNIDKLNKQADDLIKLNNGLSVVIH